MPTTHTIELHFPLPASLAPDLFIQHLQTYEPLIKPHPYLIRYNRCPVDLKGVVADPFFTEDGAKIESYEVTERIVLVPLLGLSKEVKVPAIFQSFATGVRCRADAQGGVRVWSTYEVHRRDLGAEFARAGRADSDGIARLARDRKHDIVDGTGADSPDSGDWELVEHAKVECSAIVKPFVVKTFETAHRDLCERVINDLKKRTSSPNPVRETWKNSSVAMPPTMAGLLA